MWAVAVHRASVYTSIMLCAIGICESNSWVGGQYGVWYAVHMLQVLFFRYVYHITEAYNFILHMWI